MIGKMTFSETICPVKSSCSFGLLEQNFVSCVRSLLPTNQNQSVSSEHGGGREAHGVHVQWQTSIIYRTPIKFISWEIMLVEGGAYISGGGDVM